MNKAFYSLEQVTKVYNQRKVLEEVRCKYEDELLVTRALSASNTELEYQRRVLIDALDKLLTL